VSGGDPRQDEKASVVDQQVQALRALLGSPADKAITRCGFPGSRTEAEEGEETPLGTGEVA
jgi:hypothetical protein